MPRDFGSDPYTTESNSAASAVGMVLLSVLAVMFACVLCGVLESTGSPRYDAYEENQAREAGVSRPCYEALFDSLMDHHLRANHYRGYQGDYHGAVVKAAETIRRDGSAWPSERWFSGAPGSCP